MQSIRDDNLTPAIVGGDYGTSNVELNEYTFNGPAALASIVTPKCIQTKLSCDNYTEFVIRTRYL